jgi:hypothetical protein
MCGVAGELRFDGERADVGLLDRMTGCLRRLAQVEVVVGAATVGAGSATAAG